MQALGEQPISGEDAAIEREIWRWRKRMESAEDIAEQRYAWGRMKHFIGRRSPTQVARMERARGLR